MTVERAREERTFGGEDGVLTALCFLSSFLPALTSPW